MVRNRTRTKRDQLHNPTLKRNVQTILVSGGSLTIISFVGIPRNTASATVRPIFCLFEFGLDLRLCTVPFAVKLSPCSLLLEWGPFPYPIYLTNSLPKLLELLELQLTRLTCCLKVKKDNWLFTHTANQKSLYAICGRNQTRKPDSRDKAWRTAVRWGTQPMTLVTRGRQAEKVAVAGRVLGRPRGAWKQNGPNKDTWPLQSL
eukprot:g80551.t1